MIAPSTEHAAGETRNIYFDTEGYPRYIGVDRGPGYFPQPGLAGRLIWHLFVAARLEQSCGISNLHVFLVSFDHPQANSRAFQSAPFLKSPAARFRCLKELTL
jgi:hypothetical protein